MGLIKKFFDSFKTKNTSERTLQWLIDNSSRDGNNTQPVKYSSVLYRCIQLIGDNVSEAELKFADRNTNEDLPYTHDVVQLFETPDGDDTYADFISRSAVYYSLYGEAIWIVIPSIGQMQGVYKYPARLVPVDPKCMFEVLDSNNNIAYWQYTPTYNSPKVEDGVHIPAEWVIKIKNHNPYNYHRGLSVVDSLMSKLDINRQALKFEDNFMKNGASPNLVITMDKDIPKGHTNDQAKLLALVKQFDQRHKGPQNAGRTGILTPGLDIKTIGTEHDKMQFLDTLKYTDDHVMSALGVHKTILGFTEDINRAISNDQREMLWQYTLKPMTTKFVQAINYKLLRPIDPTIKAYYDYTTVIEDQRLTVADVPILMNAGWTRNEINERLKLNFDEDESGDVRIVPFNYTTLDSIIDPIEDISSDASKMLTIERKDGNDTYIATKATNRDRQRHRQYMKTQEMYEKQFRGRLKKYFIKQRGKVLDAFHSTVKEILPPPEVILNSIEEVFNEAEDTLLQTSLTPIYEKTIQAAGDMAFEFMNINRSYVINQGILQNKINKIVGVNQTTYNQIKMNIMKGLDEGETVADISKRIKGLYAETNKSRSLTIARTETSSLISEATQKEYEDNGVEEKQWITAGDSLVRQEHQDNEAQRAIPIGNAFSNGENYPGENSVNCRCSLIPVIN